VCNWSETVFRENGKGGMEREEWNERHGKRGMEREECLLFDATLTP